MREVKRVGRAHRGREVRDVDDVAPGEPAVSELDLASFLAAGVDP